MNKNNIKNQYYWLTCDPPFPERSKARLACEAHRQDQEKHDEKNERSTLKPVRVTIQQRHDDVSVVICQSAVTSLILKSS